MQCPKCGTNINSGDKFCTGCGTKIQNSTPQSQIEQLVSEPTINKEQNNDDHLLDVYIGKNADQIKHKGFSLPLFFLGIYYCLYRKMWLMASIWISVSILLCYTITTYSSILLLIAHIIIAIKFNTWYINQAKEKIEKIKKENSDKSSEEIKEICKKKGGTALWAAIIAGIISLILLIAAIIFMFYFVGLIFEAFKGLYEAETSSSLSVIKDLLHITY